VTRAYFEEFLPLLVKRYEEVLARMEKPLTSTPRRASRRGVIERFLATRDYTLTAREFGVVRTTVNQIVYRAIRIAKDLEAASPSRRRPRAKRVPRASSAPSRGTSASAAARRR
jgi:hypothetical protein